MRIVVVGASHTSAPLPLLERLAVPPGELDSLLSRLKPEVGEAFVLSTCNRTELYVVPDADLDTELLLGVLAARADMTPAALRPFTYTLDDDACAQHAMRVASGLESMVLGEDQIQAQFKRALGTARGLELLGPVLERLGAAALACGKRVRTFTGIGQHSVSLESLAVNVSLAHLDAKAGDAVVVLGSGSSAGIVVKQLRGAGIPVTVVGRTHGPAAALATDTGSACTRWEELPDALATARAVFCCTSAPHPVLTTDLLRRRLDRPVMPLLCVDLGMPRDVEHDVATLAGVTVVSLPELAERAAAHRSARAQHLPAALAMVEREAERFIQWMDARPAADAISERRAQAAVVADAEVRRALARLQSSTAHDRKVVTELARRLVNKLLHSETTELKLRMAETGAAGREEAVS